jgi:hypothetical protein
MSDDLSTIVVANKSTDGDYDNFLKELPEEDCRWAVYDFAYKTPDGGDRNKIVFYSWYVYSLSSLFRHDWHTIHLLQATNNEIGMDMATHGRLFFLRCRMDYP